MYYQVARVISRESLNISIRFLLMIPTNFHKWCNLIHPIILFHLNFNKDSSNWCSSSNKHNLRMEIMNRQWWHKQFQFTMSLPMNSCSNNKSCSNNHYSSQIKDFNHSNSIMLFLHFSSQTKMVNLSCKGNGHLILRDLHNRHLILDK